MRFGQNKILLLLFMMIGWQLSAQTIEQKITADWKFAQADRKEWLDAKVPGCVHTDLLRHKKIADPFFGENEKKVQWIDKKDWIYKTSFNNSIEDTQKQELIFEGLDTYADVYLNDKKILSADNMFRSWTVDVSHIIKKGKNEIKIYFHSPIKKGTPLWDAVGYPLYAINDDAKTGNTGDRKLSVMTRKAGYHYGWDWGPRLVTSGIYRPITLKSWKNSRIDNIRYTQSNITAKNVDVKTEVNIKSVIPGNIEVVILDAVKGKKYASEFYNVKEGDQTLALDFKIKNPKLWWSNGLGDQHLYPIKVQIKSDGQLLDENVQNIGIRTVELVTEKDQIGESFKIRLNGHDIFMKGTNYIPGDMFLDRVSDEKMEETIKACADANMNMIRVWGGGTYEKDLFYDLCDKYGLLVWQDFMFACSLYPGDEAFVENVKQEVKDNVIRLRNHPSLAMWCGNNEIEWAWFGWGIQKELNLSEADSTKIINDYFRLFTKEIPDVLHQHDDKDYWASSPYFRKYGDHLETKGDRHLWDVWKGPKPMDYYKTHVPRFMSEYGYQSFPEVQVMKKYVKEDEVNLWSKGMRNHQKAKYGNKRIMKNLTREFGIDGKDFEKFTYISQLYQGYDLKFAIETHRRNMPHCMGSLYWQVNDCWPVASWASIDYEGNWKSAHYRIQDAYKNKISTVSLDEGVYNIYVVSDELKDESAELKVQVLDFDGNTVLEQKKKVALKANTSSLAHSIKAEDLPEQKNNLVMVTTLTQKNKIIHRNEFYSVKSKDLALSKDYDLQKEVTANSDGSYTIKLSSNKLLRGVRVNSKDHSGCLTDNYFDLLPREVKVINWVPSKESNTNVSFDFHTLNDEQKTNL
ncbi:hypothetical protein KMW28_22340 [Flammeovirga yaeyamensis]|uniref:Beta-mannosidase n=1 Tax=Flammeovirga yaeyamensis TaxID=367791 RepID=A0AAX1NDT1_9BACT|nr:glycoside hydrolase family 2 protein [Flammeovirga yaeyamensis]MBB3696901.1 beta-mannosidase [Flammeovirga yaeyamensis]NMF33565.1 glycoside hydrolase family 2 protein [Flammeovirga yaeyamensis]QWG05166.1 hypothetical protein KMW28_22340 [Flammeovirga yaeyamensis]